MSDDELVYTASADAVARALDRSAVWVRKAAVREEIGVVEGRERRYTRQDVTRLRKLVNPEETRGRPRG